ncbi:MAG: hypothetical protein J6N19_07800, partial [Clostridium sp.]|nr:hypothetical protein [Clostridium sp.]
MEGSVPGKGHVFRVQNRKFFLCIFCGFALFFCLQAGCGPIFQFLGKKNIGQMPGRMHKKLYVLLCRINKKQGSSGDLAKLICVLAKKLLLYRAEQKICSACKVSVS